MSGKPINEGKKIWSHDIFHTTISPLHFIPFVVTFCRQIQIRAAYKYFKVGTAMRISLSFCCTEQFTGNCSPTLLNIIIIINTPLSSKVNYSTTNYKRFDRTIFYRFPLIARDIRIARGIRKSKVKLLINEEFKNKEYRGTERSFTVL